MTPLVFAAVAFNCPVLVVPANAATEWADAARQSSELISHLGNTETDCSVIVIDVHGEGAHITMTTTDGRKATRSIRTPEEAYPVIRALVVTMPEESGPTHSDATPAPAATASRDVNSGRPPSNQGAPTAKSTDWNLLACGAGGARLASAAVGVSPIGSGFAAVRLGRFESGLRGSREFGYHPMGGTVPAGFALSATSAELFVGYRQPIGKWALIAGFKGATAFVVEKFDAYLQAIGTGPNAASEDFKGSVTRRITEGRAGPYVAVVYPTHFRVRLRAQVEFEYAVARLRTSQDSLPADVTPPTFPALSTWGVGLTLGIEAGLL